MTKLQELLKREEEAFENKYQPFDDNGTMIFRITKEDGQTIFRTISDGLEMIQKDLSASSTRIATTMMREMLKDVVKEFDNFSFADWSREAEVYEELKNNTLSLASKNWGITLSEEGK